MSKASNLAEYQQKINCYSQSEQQCVITDLITELAIALNGKSKLEKENLTLKTECYELKQKLSDYERSLKKEKDFLIESVKNSEDRIKEKEINLFKKDVKYLEEQKKCLLEVNNLKMSYYKQKDLFEKREAELINKIKLLKSKMTEATTGYKAMKALADSNRKKCATYKAKVKFTVGIMKELNAKVQEYQEKPLMIDQQCQTATRNNTYDNHCRSMSSLHSHYDVNTESAILAELFFRRHPSDDIENIFYKTENKITENVQESCLKKKQ